MKSDEDNDCVYFRLPRCNYWEITLDSIGCMIVFRDVDIFSGWLEVEDSLLEASEASDGEVADSEEC